MSLTALTRMAAKNFQTDEMLSSCKQVKRWMMPSRHDTFFLGSSFNTADSS